MILTDEQKREFKVDHIPENLYLHRGWKSYPVPNWSIETVEHFTVKRPSDKKVRQVLANTTQEVFNA